MKMERGARWMGDNARADVHGNRRIRGKRNAKKSGSKRRGWECLGSKMKWKEELSGCHERDIVERFTT